MIALAIVLELVSLPFRLWCRWRHRRHWVVDGFGWSWVCNLDGLDHGFSEADIRNLTEGYKAAGQAAAHEFLGDTEAVETFFGKPRL